MTVAVERKIFFFEDEGFNFKIIGPQVNSEPKTNRSFRRGVFHELECLNRLFFFKMCTVIRSEK